MLRGMLSRTVDHREMPQGHRVAPWIIERFHGDVKLHYRSSRDAMWTLSRIVDRRYMPHGRQIASWIIEICQGASSGTMDHCRATWSKAVWLARGSLLKV
jgi:hypothetical protein